MTMHNTQTNATTKATALIDRDLMTKAVATVAEVVERRNTFPILSNIRITGDGDRAFITATDMDLEMVACVPCAADSRFDTTTSAHSLRDMLKKARKSEYAALTLTPEHADQYSTIDESVTLEFDAVRYDLPALPVADYPAMAQPAHNEAVRFTIDGATLVSAIGRTKGATSTEETRYYLNGTYMHVVGDQLRFVATDGHRMYVQDVTAPDGATEAMADVIIPRKAIALLHKLTKGKATPNSLTMAVTGSKVQFAWDAGDGIAYTLTSKVIDGTFPDYQRIIPTYNDSTMTVDKAEFDGAIKDVSLISAERGSAVKLTLSSDGCKVSANNPDKGQASAAIPADYSGDEIEIGFNARYLTDLIADIEGDTLTMRLDGAGSPAVITGDCEGWKAVLMPMRV